MRFPSRLAMMLIWVSLVWASLIWVSLSALAQVDAQQSEPTAEEKKELLANQRFVELLKKKPRPGTALDRVYDFHITRGTLDEFCQQLLSEASQQSNGQSATLLGLIESRRGNDSLAKVAFEKAEELLPKEPLPSFYLGKTLILLGDTERAIAALERAIDRQPDKADSLQIFQELGRVYQRSRRTEDAIKIWKRLEGMFPGDLQVQEQIASVLEEEGDHAAALEKFNALSAATKDRFRQVELKAKAAALKLKLNQHAEAIKDFETLLSQINPGSWLHQDIRRRIDDSFQSKQDTPGLTAYYESWIEKHPEDIDAMMRIGRILSVARSSTAAQRWFQRAIDRAPSAPGPRLALVDALERDGNLHEAASAMQALCELQPGNPDYIVRCGELLLGDVSLPQAQRSAAAADVWRKLLDKHADDPVMVARVADLMRGAGLTEEAIKLYTRAVEQADAEPQYREYLGEYLHRLGRDQEAMKVWQELASGPRKNRDNLVRLSEVLTTFSFHSEALAAMEEACQMQPTFAHRLRYAAKLKDAQRYTDALAQTKLAGQQASGEEEQDQVLDLEIKVHLAASDLAEQIDALEAELAKEDQKKPETWKRLALYQEAAGKTQPALNSIRQAIQLAPQSVGLLDIAARLQQRSGLVGEAVASLRKLMTLDRRGQSRVLMQIAAMHVRLGQMDEAIKAAQEMLAAADANTEQYRYYADLCFQAGKIDQGLDALRRHLRSNPNDREAIDLLARALSNHFKTDEAIELTWRSMSKATNTAERIQSVQMLSELYTRNNNFEELIKRLTGYGREENRTRESTMLMAAAHQSIGDLASARELLEPLATEDVRDTVLLNNLVDLARAEGDWDAAVNYQTRLNNLSPSSEGGMELAKLLLERGDIEQAETVWNKYAGKKMSPSDLQSNLQQLLTIGEMDKALGLMERAINSAPDDWEVLTVCMQMYVHADELDKAKAVAEKILQLKLPRETLTASAAGRRAGPSAAPASSSTLGVDRRSCMIRAVLIAANLTTNSLFVSPPAQSRLSTPAVVCFGDARLIALYLTSIDASRQVKGLLSLHQSVQQENDLDKLWDAAFLLNFAPVVETGSSSSNNMTRGLPSGLGITPIQTYGQSVTLSVGNTTTTLYRPDPINSSNALRRLAELGEQEAILCLAQNAVSTLRLTQNLQQAGAIRTAQALLRSNAPRLDPKRLDEYLALLRKIQANPVSAQDPQVVLLSLYMAAELRAMDRRDESEELLKFFRQNGRTAPTMLHARLLLPLDVELAIDTSLAAIKTQLPTSRQPSAGRPITSTSLYETAMFFSELLDRPQAVAGLETEAPLANLHRHNPLRLISELKKIQAERARRMRPSELASYSPSANVVFPLITTPSTGANRLQLIPFPAASPLQSAELLTAMYMIHISTNTVYRQQLERLLQAEAEQADDDAMQSAVDHLCYLVWLHWNGNKDGATRELAALQQTFVAGDLACMLGSRIYFENGRTQEALQLLEKLNPITTELMQERDLAILQLAVKASDQERAKRAAERLFAMRLNPRYETQIATLMSQLGMTEMSRSLMQRVQQRSGTQLPMLAQLMNQHRAQKNEAAALSIAQQIVRRTRPTRGNVASGSSVSPTTGVRTTNDSYRQQAMQVLANSSQAKEQIKQLEARLADNPKSSFLVNQLAEWYEATGRSTEATKLREQWKANSKSNSQSALASTLANYRQTRPQESVAGYLSIFNDHPELFEREFESFFNATLQYRAWDSVANALGDWPLERFSTPSEKMDRLLQYTVRSSSPEQVEKLLQKLLLLDDFVPRYASAFANTGKALKLSEPTQNLLDQRLCQALAKRELSLPPLPAVRGHVRGTLTILHALVTNPTSVTKVLQTIEPLSERNSLLKCLEVLMHLRNSDENSARRALDQALAMPADANYIIEWELASELTNAKRYEWAIELMKRVDEKAPPGHSAENSPKTLLLECYLATKNVDKAKAILDGYLVELKEKSTSGGSGSTLPLQDIQHAIVIAQKYYESDCPVECLCTILWVRQDPALMSVSSARDPSNNSYISTLVQLEHKAKNKIDGPAVLRILRSEFDATRQTADNVRVSQLPAIGLVPDSIIVTAPGALPVSRMHDLLTHLKSDASAYADAQTLLSQFTQSPWQELRPRTLLMAMYLADGLNQPDAYIRLAGELHQRYAQAKSDGLSQELKTLQPACWLIAEKLAEYRHAELAQQFAAYGAAGNESIDMVPARFRLRIAQALQANDSQPAAEVQLRSLLDYLYPQQKSQTKN